MTDTAQKNQENSESKKKVGHIEKSQSLLPRKIKKMQKTRKNREYKEKPLLQYM